MKKMFILASIALVGAACSKSDDNGGGNNGGGNPVTPSEVPAVYPTEKRGDDQNYSQTTYTLENNKVKTVVRERYQNGVKDATATRTTNVTYTDKKYPTVVEETYNGSFTNKTEYTYNEKNQITEMKNTREGSTQVVKFEYNAEGKVSKAIHPTYQVSYEYPNATTVVEKNSSTPNSTNTYTIVNGNVTKFLQESKDDLGTVRFTNTQEYEYNTAVKNPDASFERRYLILAISTTIVLMMQIIATICILREQIPIMTMVTQILELIRIPMRLMTKAILPRKQKYLKEEIRLPLIPTKRILLS